MSETDQILNSFLIFYACHLYQVFSNKLLSFSNLLFGLLDLFFMDCPHDKVEAAALPIFSSSTLK